MHKTTLQKTKPGGCETQSVDKARQMTSRERLWVPLLHTSARNTSRKKPPENPQDTLFIFMEVDGKRTMRENWGEP